MLITNLPHHGGDLSSYFFKQLNDSRTERVRMISGYVGNESIKRLHQEIKRIDHVALELVVGMAAKEGLPQQTYDALRQLNDELRSRKHSKFVRQGVFAFFSGPNGERSRGMHAKAYLFDRKKSQQLVVGSSNFSFSGLALDGNVEMNLVDENGDTTKRFVQFFEDLHAGKMAVPIDLIEDFPIRGKAARSRKRDMATLTKVRGPIGFKRFKYVDIDLARNIDGQSRSNLNCCFGKGRWSRATGIVRPRDWYEVELICSMDVTSDSSYPRGEFDVVTSDGFAFRGVTNGDHFKNLRSADDLKILGLWLKGVLEDAGCLSDDPQELVTNETFRSYGNSVLRIYRPSAKTAVFHFPRKSSEL